MDVPGRRTRGEDVVQGPEVEGSGKEVVLWAL